MLPVLRAGFRCHLGAAEDIEIHKSSRLAPLLIEAARVGLRFRGECEFCRPILEPIELLTHGRRAAGNQQGFH